jgi:hypothetical protein
MQVPASAPGAATAPAPSTPSAPPQGQGSAGAEPTKQCPFCGETILKIARKCKHCKEDLDEGSDEENIRARLQAKLDKLPKTGGVPEIPWSVGGKIRIRTIVAVVITVLGIAVGALFIASGDRDLEPLSFAPFSVAFISLICMLVALINDVRTPSADARTTPDAGFKAFMHSVRIGRFKYAYACLLDGEKDGTKRKRKGFATLKLSPATFSFATYDGFKRYWKELVRPSAGQSRSMGFSSVAVEKQEGDWALVRAQATFKAYPSGLIILVIFGVPGILLALILVAALTKRARLSVIKLMRRVGNQWYVVNGELDSPEDRAIGVAGELKAGS